MYVLVFTAETREAQVCVVRDLRGKWRRYNRRLEWEHPGVGKRYLTVSRSPVKKDHVCRVYTVSESAEKESVPRLKIGVWSKIEKAVCFHLTRRRSVRQKHNEKNQ